jgi:hypothetical protein
MKRIITVLSLALVLAVTAFAQPALVKAAKAACGSCCGDNCSKSCCPDRCGDCCQGK